MSQGIAEVIAAALRSTLGLACLPQLLLLLLLGLLLQGLPRLSGRAVAVWLSSTLLYALVAMKDRGQAWPELDSVSAALSHPLPWAAAIPLLAALVLTRLDGRFPGNVLLPPLLLVAAALSRPGQDPVALLQLRASLAADAETGKIFAFHLVQGVALTAVLVLASSLVRRWLGERAGMAAVMAAGGRWLLGLCAAAFLSGVYGMLCRFWILHWPPGAS